MNAVLNAACTACPEQLRRAAAAAALLPRRRSEPAGLALALHFPVRATRTCCKPFRRREPANRFNLAACAPSAPGGPMAAKRRFTTALLLIVTLAGAAGRPAAGSSRNAAWRPAGDAAPAAPAAAPAAPHAARRLAVHEQQAADANAAGAAGDEGPPVLPPPGAPLPPGTLAVRTSQQLATAMMDPSVTRVRARQLKPHAACTHACVTRLHACMQPCKRAGMHAHKRLAPLPGTLAAPPPCSSPHHLAAPLTCTPPSRPDSFERHPLHAEPGAVPRPRRGALPGAR